MGKIRDAETGHYLSAEEAATRDKSTWVEEHDEHKAKFAHHVKLLSDLYSKIEEKSFRQGGLTDSFIALRLDDVKLAFKDFGLDVDAE